MKKIRNQNDNQTKKMECPRCKTSSIGPCTMHVYGSDPVKIKERIYVGKFVCSSCYLRFSKTKKRWEPLPYLSEPPIPRQYLNPSIEWDMNKHMWYMDFRWYTPNTQSLKKKTNPKTKTHLKTKARNVETISEFN